MTTATMTTKLNPTHIKAPHEMSADELRSLIRETDDRVRELDRTMARTHSDTLAWKAMNESRPDLLRFRRSLDDVLADMGA